MVGGVSIGDYGKVRSNIIRHQGQIGVMVNGGAQILFEGNEVSYNNQEGFELTWGGGGSKFAESKNLTIKKNYFHHNNGTGIWVDIDNIDTIIDGNISTYNLKNGIHHEISFDADIMNNFVAFNGSTKNGEGYFRQISIANSSNVNVYNNTAVTHPSYGGGIVTKSTVRGYSNIFPEGVCNASRKSSTCSPWVVKNVKVYQNKIYHQNSNSPVSGLFAWENESFPNDFRSISQTVKHSNNQYYLPSNLMNTKHWNWGSWGKSKTFSEWKSFGQDSTESLRTLTSVPSTPSLSTPVGPQNNTTF